MSNDQPDWTSVIARPGLAAPGSPFSLAVGANSQSITLQSDTHALGVVFTNASTVIRLQVVGNQSNAVYLDINVSLQSPTGVIWVPVQSAADTSVTVTETVTNTGSVFISLIADPSAVGVFTPVLPPWQAPNQPPLAIDTGSLAANGVFVILAAASSFRFYLHSLTLDILAVTGNWILETTNGVALASFSQFQSGTPTNVINPARPPWEAHGAPLPKGLGLQLHNTSAGATRWIGSLTYSQSTS